MGFLCVRGLPLPFAGYSAHTHTHAQTHGNIDTSGICVSRGLRQRKPMTELSIEAVPQVGDVIEGTIKSLSEANRNNWAGGTLSKPKWGWGWVGCGVCFPQLYLRGTCGGWESIPKCMAVSSVINPDSTRSPGPHEGKRVDAHGATHHGGSLSNSPWCALGCSFETQPLKKRAQGKCLFFLFWLPLTANSVPLKGGDPG